MRVYLRKSVSLGGVRFNFSKSGIVASVSIKGFRLGTGPRGNYVHMGRNGIYYFESPVFLSVYKPSTFCQIEF